MYNKQHLTTFAIIAAIFSFSHKEIAQNHIPLSKRGYRGRHRSHSPHRSPGNYKVKFGISK